jgi:hypothetical protein
VPRLRAGVIVGGTGRNVSQLMSCSVAILDWSLVAAQGRDNADLMHLLILDLRHGDDIERVIPRRSAILDAFEAARKV